MAVTTANGATNNVSSIAALQSAINGAAAGDVIVLANGHYTNNTFSVSTSGIKVITATPGGVFLDGTNNITISASRTTFSGFQFTSGTIAGIAIVVTGSSNVLTQLNFDGYIAQKYIHLNTPGLSNVISHCNFRNKPVGAPAGNLIHVSALSNQPGYHKIRYCSFQDMPGAGGDNGNECIRLENGAQSTYIARTVVEYCYFENTGPGDSEAISVKCRQNVIRYCTFTNNPDAMLVFRNGNDNVAYGNFFIASGGIRPKEANNIYCYNNYFENSGIGGTMNAVKLDYVSPNLNNINFFHNTFVNCGTIDLGGSGPVSNTWANNIFKKSSGNIFLNPNTGTSWAGNIYTGTLGIVISSGMTNLNPQLALNSDNYYGLSSNSPAIDAASTNYPAILDIPSVDDDPTIALDISGQPRPASKTLKDVGCDEYTNGITINRPLTLADVGPSYLGGPGAPVANFFGMPTSGTAPLSVTFTNTSIGQTGLSHWDLGDGALDTNALSFVHIYTAGTYTVSLTVTNDGGSSTKTNTAYITAYTTVLGTTTNTYTTAGTTNWICPAGINSIQVECWGGGGGGGGAHKPSGGSNSNGGGGGGGAYAKLNSYTVTPGNQYTLVVGAGGTTSVAGNGGLGGDSYLTNTVANTAPCLAKGGSGGTAGSGANGTGGLGATTNSCAGDVLRAGGNGWSPTLGDAGAGGGGGGGSGGYSLDGISAISTNGASAVPGGGNGGNGRGQPSGAGNGFTPTAPPGGGGGGGRATGTGTDWAGGAGAAGQVILIYSPASCTTALANFTATPTNGVVPLTVVFTDMSSNSPTGWNWDFGDTVTSSVQNASHTYLQAGNFTVTLSASNACGGSTFISSNLISVITAQQSWSNFYGVAADVGDADGDGMSNTNEFLTGFSPNNNATCLRITGVVRSGNDVSITYLGANGDTSYVGGPSSRTNVLEYSTGTDVGGYTNNFVNAGISQILSNGTGTGTITNMVDTGGATNVPSRYYRVRVLVP